MERFGAEECPLVLLDSWADLPAFLRSFQAAPGAAAAVALARAADADALQAKALAWAEGIKDRAAQDVLELVLPEEAAASAEASERGRQRA